MPALLGLMMTTTDCPTFPVLPAGPLPACGFKEWSMVCDALGAGEQSIILRKGGIHEGRSGFFWKHDAFFLFPTRFHEQSVQFPWPGGVAPECGDDDRPHTLTLFAVVEEKLQLTDWAQVESLRGFHFWTEEATRDRCDYTDNSGISLALLRVWRLRGRCTQGELARRAVAERFLWLRGATNRRDIAEDRGCAAASAAGRIAAQSTSWASRRARERFARLVWA